MDHAQFKARQTAAVYVADGLDEQTLEEFEMHMMGCTECVADVESWRAIKLNMPRRRGVPGRADRLGADRPTRAPATVGQGGPAAVGWRMAASLVVGGVLGAAGGWFGHETQAPNLDSSQTAFFSVPAATRGGADCTSLRYAPETKFAVLRVSGVSRDRKVIAADAEKHELPASRYTSRLQPDGSHLLRVDTQALEGREIFLEALAADGFGEPLGCVAGEIVSSRR
jgi:anti-sigma factor RsiW